MKTDTGLMGGQEIERATPTWVIRRRAARMGRIARVMSGELEGTGCVVKNVRLMNQKLAYTDGETVTLPTHIDPDPRLNLLMQEAILAHEAAGHHRYTNFADWFSVTEQIRLGHEDRQLHHMINIVEDARVNHLLSQDFPGSGQRLNLTQSIMMGRHVEHWNESGVTEDNRHHAAVVALMTETIVGEPHFFTDDIVCAFMDDVRPLIPNAISQPSTKGVIRQAKRINKIYRDYFPEDSTPSGGCSNPAQNGHGEGVMTDDMSEGQIAQMKRAQEEAGQEVEEVSKARFGDLERPEEGPSADEGDGECEGDGEGDGDGDGGDDGKAGLEAGDADGSGDGCDGEGEDSLDFGGDGEGSRSDSDERVGEDHLQDEKGRDYKATVEPKPEGGGAPNTGDGSLVNVEVTGDLDWEIERLFAEAVEVIEDENLSALQDEADTVREVDDSWDTDAEMFDSRDDWGHHIEVISRTHEMLERGAIHLQDSADLYDNIVNDNEQAIKQLVKEISRNIKGRNTMWTTGYKRGKLDSGSLYKHSTSNRLFKRRNVPHVPEADVLILIDASGSMGCNESGKTRAQWASEAAVVLTEALDRLNFNHEVVDFNSDYDSGAGKSAIRVRRQAGATLSVPVKAAIAAPFVGSQNSDGNCLLWAANRVRRMGRGFKFVFVISDGAPAGPSPRNYSANEFLVKAVRTLKSEGDVEVFSIGIAGMDTSRFYDNAVKVTNTADLAEESLPVLRGLLKAAIKKQGVVQ